MKNVTKTRKKDSHLVTCYYVLWVFFGKCLATESRMKKLHTEHNVAQTEVDLCISFVKCSAGII